MKLVAGGIRFRVLIHSNSQNGCAGINLALKSGHNRMPRVNIHVGHDLRIPGGPPFNDRATTDPAASTKLMLFYGLVTTHAARNIPRYQAHTCPIARLAYGCVLCIAIYTSTR